MVSLKLTQVSFLLDELDMVVLAVKSPLMSDIVGRADRASAMAAFEATFVVWSSIYSDLQIETSS